MDDDDATRRTWLANERTYLAWWRTGLTALAVGLAAGRIVPELASGAAWPYELLGTGYAVLGLCFIAYGHRRRVEVERALVRGDWAPISAGVTLALTGAGVVMALATIAVVVFAR
jgi:putative membrane protein